MDSKIPDHVRTFRILHILADLLCCLIAVLGLLFLTRNIVNFAFLKNYEKGSYSRLPESALSPLRLGQNYIVPYNMGNIEYQLGDYEKAAAYYQQALRSDPPARDEECMIRVNLALAMCHTINFEDMNLSDQDAVSEAVDTLLNARSVLTVHECASESADTDDGHFADADRLKHDIDDMLKKLQNRSESGEDQKKKSDPQKEEDKDQQEGKDNSDDHRSSQQKQAEQARQDELKDQLSRQKKDLENGNSSTNGNGFHYIEGGNTSGYGDGTLW